MLTIYKASAGSGKTFTLAYEYLKMLLGYKDTKGRYHLYAPKGKSGMRRHRHILAITFTNAATEEMKSRIVLQLDNLRQPDAQSKTPYTDMLCKEFGCTADALRQASGAALHDLLFDYDSFNVSTIDSFFQSVMRTFSRELDRQGDYDLAIDNKEVISDSIGRMLDNLNYDRGHQDTQLYQWIKSYSLDSMLQGKAGNFFNRQSYMLATLSKEMGKATDETYAMHAREMREYFARPELFSNFVEFLKEKSRSFGKSKDLALQIYKKIAEHGVDQSLLKDGLTGRLKRAVSPLPQERLKESIGAKFLYNPQLEKKDFAPQKSFKLPGVQELFDDAHELVTEFFGQYVKDVNISIIAGELLKSTGYQIFISMAQRSLEDLLRENNTVLLSSTGELLKQIISEEEMPFIYERLGMQLEHLLIDEFQDTSRLQWSNLKPLVANSLANSFDNLIIGDEKQSIYRWRNSDSELLGSYVQTVDFPDNHVTRGHQAKDNTNHRSAGDIVRFNNTLFKLLGSAYGAQHYGNVVQTPADNLASLPAYIRVDFNEGMAEDEIFEKLCTEILRQHADGYKWSDIMVLVRSNKEATRFVSYVSEAHPEIRLISSEALLLKNSPAVRAVVSMLKLISRSYQGKQVTRADDAPRYASKDDIVLMIMRYNHYLSQGEEAPAALEMALHEGYDAGKELTAQIKAIKAENPANLVAMVEAVIAHKLSARQRSEEYAYIAALQDLAIAHAEGPEPSLAKFLEAWDLKEDDWAIKAPAHLDAVQVMTVHKAKGLERACVHIPFADWTLHQKTDLWVELTDKGFFEGTTPPPLLHIEVSNGSLLFNAEYSPVAGQLEKEIRAQYIDNLNVTYVAFTRASRELNIIFNGKKGMGGDVFRAVEGCRESLGEHTMALAGYYRPEYNLLEIGGPTRPRQEKDKESNVVDAGEYGVEFRKSIRALVSIDDALSDNMDIGGEDDRLIVDTPAGGSEVMRAASQRGMDLHAILAGARTLDDIERSLRRYCARAGLDAGTAADYRAELAAAIAHDRPMAEQWFAPDCKVFPERSIYDSASGETFRPDRIVLTADGRCLVVDYKFTTAPLAKHRRQIENYAGLLARLGYENIETYLWYPLLRKIILHKPAAL